MNLEQFAHRYFENHETGIRENTQRCYYLPAARMFEEATGCNDIATLNKETANRFVEWLKSQPKSPRTQSGRRKAFATLWKAASEADLAPPYEEFRKIRVPKKSPRAWSFEEVQTLVRDCLEDRSEWLNGIESGIYWGSLFSAAWDSALRLGDLLSLEYSWIQQREGAGFLRIVQSKTEREHCVQFSASTMELVRESMRQSPKRRLIWPQRTDRRRFYLHVQKILQKSGLNGSFRFLRRSAVTYAEGQQPGAGQRLADHRDSRTTRESYIDPLLLPDSVVTVKPLEIRPNDKRKKPE